MIKYTSFYDGVFTCLHNSSLRLNRHFFLIPLRWRIGQILLICDWTVTVGLHALTTKYLEINSILAKQCLWLNYVIKNTLKLNYFLAKEWPSRYGKCISPPYSRICLQNCTKTKIYDVHLKLQLMLRSREK